jgi:hypothetical protein
MKKYYFTCCSIIEGSLRAETFFTENRDNAYNLFKEKWGDSPSFLDGPFYRKLEKNKKPVYNKEIKLGCKIIQGKVKNSKIKGIILLQPENYVFVTFCEDKELNQKIIHISEVKEIS